MNFKKIALLSTSFILTIVGCGSVEPSSTINSSSELIESSGSISTSSNESIEDYSSFIEESIESIESSNEENFLDLGTFYPEHEAEVCLASDEVQEWLEDYHYGSSEPYQGKGDIYLPKNVDMHWDKIQNAEYYQVNLALKEDFSDANTYVTLSNKLSLNDLYVASTYYWNIEAFDVNGELIGTSRNYNFATMALPRTINIDGVSNTRDIGGKKTINGKKIKQGMLYRTATIDNITDKGKKSALYTYGIKTDLDLRNAGEGYKGASPIDPNLNYVNVPGCYWVGGNDGLDNEDNWENRMLKELKVFTKKENYPIVFHCSLGQDRTGSLALVLEALLGVTGNELAIDYELSSFSKVVWDAGVIWVSDKLHYQYGPLYDYLDSFGTEENTFMEKVELYVKAVGLTDADIASIRSIMWEE